MEHRSGLQSLEGKGERLIHLLRVEIRRDLSYKLKPEGKDLRVSAAIS